jgi:transposase-like protein
MPSSRHGFRPPFCPNPECDSRADPGRWRFKKKGFHPRQGRPHRIQRYLCQHCQRNFSSQTFSPTYWLRHRTLLRPLFFRVLACSALRQIAAEFGVSHATIQRQIERLGRHCLLLHESLRPREAPREPVVLDGLRTFESGQYWPYDLQVLVGASHFVYGFNDAELRRSGTMTPAQHRRRARLERRYGRPDPQATRRAAEELLRRLLPPGSEATLHSDEHPGYVQALGRLPDRKIHHGKTSSKASRTPANPLFPVNLADLLLRHTGANHKRETIAFSKRRQGALYRAAIFTVWRNYVKSSSEARRDDPPGVKLGIIERRMTVGVLLRERRFPWRAGLRGWLARCYFGRIRTRCLAHCRPHALRYAA